MEKKKWIKIAYCNVYQKALYFLLNFQNTVMQRWSLVCDADVYFKTLSQSIFFVGHFVGTLIAGFMGDRLGRKRAFILTLFPTAGFGFASYFVDHPYGWMAIRFFVGVTSMAATTLKTVYTVSMNVK
jgi:MFS family permease